MGEGLNLGLRFWWLFYGMVLMEMGKCLGLAGDSLKLAIV
jgi:hypothetical protein